ncbi:hypothetical protein Q8A67_015377 [Cirrhinus molitorella]|uniref:Uncharacterized protein n=1 Tax=Cirrhinus molitorella TaxID=172907 RepID=A0AA88TIS1_9TELE|nr:hypothetical protein Q8A67_015377 [Cirrhinus molitorella]
MQSLFKRHVQCSTFTFNFRRPLLALWVSWLTDGPGPPSTHPPQSFLVSERRVGKQRRRWQTEVWLIGSLRDKELQERRAPACSYPPSGEPLSLGMGQSFSFPPSIAPSLSIPVPL